MKNRRRTLSGILKSNEFTEFEKKVYGIVALIPEGSVRSYKWVAKRIGRPRSYRAVGNALNKNRHPSVIPCHRVIKSDGSIGGYARGAGVKKEMLRSEGKGEGKARRKMLDEIRDELKRIEKKIEELRGYL